MTLGMRIILLGLIGLLAGALCWPFTELILFYQASFPTLLLFSVVLGVAVGLFMGGSFGMSEGALTNSWAKVRSGGATGALIGCVGGMLGFIAGQTALLAVGSFFFNTTGQLRNYGIPISRALGWAVFGMVVGVGEGVRSRSGAKALNGIIGGFAGGLAGGLVVEYIRLLSPSSGYARLAGLCVLGLFIGIAYALVERSLAKASLRLLSGRSRGREFLLTQGRTVVGGAQKTDVTLAGYGRVAGEHAEIHRDGRDFTLVQGDGKKPVYVNDEKVERTVLRDGDIIRIGDAQFQFARKRGENR
jgi:hypothetical protein